MVYLGSFLDSKNDYGFYVTFPELGAQNKLRASAINTVSVNEIQSTLSNNMFDLFL